MRNLLIIGLGSMLWITFSKAAERISPFVQSGIDIEASSFKLEHPKIFGGVEAYRKNRAEGLSNLRRMISSKDDINPIVVMQTLIYLRVKELQEKYPDISHKELGLKADPSIDGPYGVALLKKGKFKDVLPALILEAEYFSTMAGVMLWDIYKFGMDDVSPKYNPKILALFQALADDDSERFKLYLGIIHLNGLGVKQDAEKGISYLKRTALPEAYKILGKYLWHERKDYQSAKQYYEKAILDKDYDAYLELAELELQNKKYDLARTNLTTLLKLDPTNSSAISGLGYLYLYGIGVKPDCQKGISDLTIAADKYNNPHAQFILYLAHSAQKNNSLFSCLMQSFEKAIYYLNKSAQQEFEPALDEKERLKKL